MKPVIFVSDRFMTENDYTHGIGGAEKSDYALIEALTENNYEVIKIPSKDFKDSSPNIPKIISNCTGLKCNSVENINNPEYQISNYVLIHHDYQYLSTRNPWSPQSLVMLGILKLMTNAKANFYQTDFHQSTTINNLQPFIDKHYQHQYKINNPISLSCTLFSRQELNFIEQIRNEKIENPGTFFILNTPNPIKGLRKTIEHANIYGLKYELIPPMKQFELFTKILQYEGMIFFPETPETCCRMAIEVKALGRACITSVNYGASTSEWFKLSGNDLVNKVRQLNREAIHRIIETI